MSNVVASNSAVQQYIFVSCIVAAHIVRDGVETSASEEIMGEYPGTYGTRTKEKI